MAEPKRYVSRNKLIKLCLEKASEIVDAVNAVPHCRVFKVTKAEPLYEGMGVIRLDITFEPPYPQE
jgi:hypothetical protein